MAIGVLGLSSEDMVFMTLSDLIEAYEARVELTQWVVWSNFIPYDDKKKLTSPDKVGYPFDHNKKKATKPKQFSQIIRKDGK